MFHLLIADDPEVGADDPETEAALHAALLAEQPLPEPQAPPADDTPRVALYALVGICPRDTMQLPIFINGHRLEALIDTGSSHTFVDAAVVRNVTMLLGCEEFSISCFSIRLGGFDLVLGADFLRTLGTILLDLDSLRMAFEWCGRRVFWRGLGVPHQEDAEAHVHSVVVDPDRPFIDNLLRE